MDLVSGYHQLEQSRYITFSTHVGLKRYKPLIFGLSSSAEIFQNTLQNALCGLEGVRNISDNIIVFGKTQEEHDRNLEATFAHLKEKNLTINRQKYEFNKYKLSFYRFIFSKDGISADSMELQKKVIELAHQGHHGIAHTKSLLREKVWFPYIDMQVEELCTGCIPCLASVSKNESEPLKCQSYLMDHGQRSVPNFMNH